ncbi:universal stress protein [Geodermatophilus sp. SYSU D00758]
MSTGLYVTLVVLLWLACGLGAAFFLLARHGYRDRRWYLIGGALGPLFVPIAVERGRRSSGVLERAGADPAPTPAAGAAPARDPGRGPTVVVGLDRSAGSDDAVRLAGRLFDGSGARVVLVSVLDPDVGEFGDRRTQQEWHDHLAERCRWLRPGAEAPVLEICTGDPGPALVAVARSEDADVLVVGRRGRGLTHRLLGSVADHALRHADVPVLLVPPAR